MPLSGAAARLEELLDNIRMTFESVSQDVEHSKNQHNDYERRCMIFINVFLTAASAQVQEIAGIRGQLYDLEKQHQRIKQESVSPVDKTNNQSRC